MMLLVHGIIDSTLKYRTHGQGHHAGLDWTRDLLLLQGFLQEGKPVQVAAFLMLLRAKVPPWHSCHIVRGTSSSHKSTWRSQCLWLYLNWDSNTCATMQGETADEVAGLARAMLHVAVPVQAGSDGVCICAAATSASHGDLRMYVIHSIPKPHAFYSQVQCDSGPPAVLDIVGTGGDNIGSVNISTGACVVAAAAGGRVAKHGSRSWSSLCGSADVLEVQLC